MSIAASYRQGMELYRQGRYDEAISALSVVGAEPGLMGQLARFYQGQSCRKAGLNQARAGRLNSAKDYLGRAVKLTGPNADLAFYLARIYQKLGLDDRAEAQLDAAVETSPDPRQPLAALALSQFRAGKTAQAMMTLTDALREYPESPELHVQMGLLLAAEQQFDQAQQHFAEAVAADCACFDGFYHLGLCQAARGEFASAAAHLDRAWALQPSNLLVAYQLAFIAKASAEQGRPVQLTIREARTDELSQTYLDHLVGMLTAEPDLVDAMLALPESEADGEIFGLVSVVLSAALERFSHYADLHLRQSMVYHRLGDTHLARRHAEEALRRNPRYLQARIHLGRLLAPVSPAEAARHLERAVADGGDYADVRMLLAQVFARLNLAEESRAHLARAIKINPSLAPAERNVPARRAA